MRHSGRLAMISGVVLAATILGGGYAFLSARSGDAPPPVSLSADGGAVSARRGTPWRSGADGAWHVTTGDSTFVGYRIREQLLIAESPDDAVGRSGAVSGGMRISGGRVEAVHIDADLSQLASDQQLRDKALKQAALETDRYPMAMFDLSEPITFPAVPEEGQVVSARARGNLTVHGVTRPVTMALRAQWNGNVIKMSGQMPMRLADHRIKPPRLGAVVSIAEKGTIEVSLDFARG